MQRLTPLLGLLVCAWTLLATPAGAQDLEHGTWTGLMTPPGGQPIPVSFEIGETDGSLSIVMKHETLPDMAFTDERIEGDELTFWWEPGTRVDCSLTRQGDGSFQGVCADDRGADGGEGPIEMRPPSG
jgi:hypothetical protein